MPLKINHLCGFQFNEIFKPRFIHILVDRTTLSYEFIITELVHSEILTMIIKAFICESVILIIKSSKELLYDSDDLSYTLSIEALSLDNLS